MEITPFLQRKVLPFVAELAFKIVQEALKKVGEEIKWSEIRININKTIEESQVPKAFHGFLERCMDFLVSEMSKIFSEENLSKYEDVNSWSVAFFGKKIFEDGDLGELKDLPKA